VPGRQLRQPGTYCRLARLTKTETNKTETNKTETNKTELTPQKDYPAMSLAARNAERSTLKRLLELSQQQMNILEADDLLAFDVILAEKRTLIETLKNGPAILAADPSLETLVARIQDADKAAQRLLYQKVGQVMREMNRVNRQQQARGAYHEAKPSASPKPLGFLPDTPMFMDVRS